MKIEFYKHNIDESDISRVEGVLRSIFLTTGDIVQNFEDQLAWYLGSKNVIGVTSCTAALHLCLLAWEIGEGDEVITTPMSFCATANAILHAGATPVFVDVEEETGNLNVELIEDAITEKTKAIMPVHLYGQLCDMRKIHKIAQNHNLVVIEDAAHAIEAQRDGIKPGDLSDCVCFSFYATKNITSGEGGAIATNNTEKAKLLYMLRLHGIDKSAIDRYTKRYQHWDMSVLGWKYNMDNIQASLLIGQLERIDKFWERRDYLWNLYEEKLRDNAGIEILKTVAGSRHAHHLFTILVTDRKRDSVLFSLQEKGVGVAVNYRPIHLLKYYRSRFGYKEGDFPVAEKIGARTISIPLYPGLKDIEVDYIVTSLQHIL
ncbi:MAG: DegT/DnrJ/EryC1/StrS family aminotransferase [Candidatus Scalindua sp. AMX11]|nr:MAG: DegT/DnrJ/EryC1/StrS family aminotransferase [Candidatus Scalindua sp.]NOG84110.1 DegT/DnrJ/EryC1/StrS family aminotransferase [Planctomycetota bacterium]RZV98980.1 MAG: DegT/DnrJ/EryC1/StrS family aminotransferase [Candidatus Scalindua sp. SCAELEC01]TDE66828.1 MAG: DegT/DnrJ/EryC1/StrS family aminotransferase [Candidatus Scalindua sp. AMX11]GJQ57627.1 MAG: spore coat protein [Candidatus Scalindua sp.]